MLIRWGLRAGAVLLVLALGCSVAVRGATQERRPSQPQGVAAEIEKLPVGSDLWYAVDARVGRALIEGDRRVLQRQLASRPTSTPLLLARLDLALRSGQRESARTLLRQVAGRKDFRQSGAGDSLSWELVRRKEWSLAEDLLLRSPTREVGSNHALIKHIAETRGVAAADKLLERLAADGNESWTTQWVTFRSQHGGADSLLKKLAGDVRARPQSLERVGLYLRAAQAAGTPVDVNWVGDVCIPKRSLDSHSLGTRLVGMRAYAGAVRLLERSLATPLTEAEVREFSMTVQTLMAHPERQLRAWTRRALAEAYKGLGRTDLAQRQVEELAKIEREIGRLTPWTAALAGAVQGESGQRTIERSVLQDEQANKDSPEYWLTRGSYYAGRGEGQPARQAFEKALSLAPIAAGTERTKGGTVRLRIIQQYANYLRRSQTVEAIAMVRRELARPGQNDDERGMILSWLINVHRDAQLDVPPDDGLLWATLAAAPRWGHAEEGCLRAMLDSVSPRTGMSETPTPQKLAVIERAEKLCSGADASRAKTLGWICSRYGYPEHALPLLTDAVARLTDEHERDGAAVNLLEVHLALGDPASAEQMLPRALRHLTLGEAPSWIARVATAHARSGGAAPAMRLWRRVANMDATFVLPVRTLAQAGLTEELRAFYTEQRKLDPDSWVPSAMLDHLARPLTIENWIEYEAN